MSAAKKIVYSNHEESKLSVKSYVIGFCMSLILTLSAYLLVSHHSATTTILLVVIVALALVQFMVQIYFFLHLGKETKPRWKLFVFLFMIGVVLILVFGSIWIINNLNTRQTLPQELQYMNSQGGF
jgi:cytochrome o ubiquinol oxidase operon protein cyoD